MIVYLIRHGQASLMAQNYDQLSNLGEQQALRLGESLHQRGLSFEHIELGDMQRHRQTAQGTLANLPRAPALNSWRIDNGWNEYDHQDIVIQQGKALGEDFRQVDNISAYVKRHSDPQQAFLNLFKQAMQRWMSGQHDTDYSESFRAFCQRIQTTFNRLLAEQPAKHVAVFTSGGVISRLAQTLLKTDNQQFVALNFTVLNAGVSKILYSKEQARLMSFNEHSAFEGQHQHLVSYR